MMKIKRISKHDLLEAIWDLERKVDDLTATDADYQISLFPEEEPEMDAMLDRPEINV